MSFPEKVLSFNLLSFLLLLFYGLVGVVCFATESFLQMKSYLKSNMYKRSGMTISQTSPFSPPHLDWLMHSEDLSRSTVVTIHI